MTNNAQHRAGLHLQQRALALLGAALLGLATPAKAADAPYPFEGTWVRADRACTPAAPHARTYTHREVASTGDRCMFRRVEFGSGDWELDEECRRPERRRITERVHMLGPDAILVRRQVVRLKIPRGRRFVRCTIAANAAAVPAKPPAAVPHTLPPQPRPPANPPKSPLVSPAAH